MSMLHLLASLEVHQTHLATHKHAFAWKMAPHPFAQRLLVASDGGHTFRSHAAMYPCQDIATRMNGLESVLLNVGGSHIAADAPLMQAGINSLAAVTLSARLKVLSGLQLSPTLVFEQPTPRAIALHLATLGEDGALATPDGVVAAMQDLLPKHSPVGTTVEDARANDGSSAATLHEVESFHVRPDMGSKNEKRMPAHCNSSCILSNAVNLAAVNPSKWRAFTIEVQRTASRHGGRFDAARLDYGSGTLFAPADELSGLVMKVQMVVNDATSNLGIPMTGPMIRDYSKGAFHMVQMIHLQMDDDIWMVQSTLDRLKASHPMLRSVHNPPWMHLCDQSMCELDEGLLAADGVNEVPSLVIDLSRAVLRARVYRSKGSRRVLLGLCLHHSVLDGPSQQIVYQHVLQLLQAERRGQSFKQAAHSEARLAEDAIAQHVGTLRAHLGNEVSQPSLQLQPELPFGLSTRQTIGMEAAQLHIPHRAVAMAQTFAAGCGLTLNALLLGTLGLLLHEHSGSSHILLATTFLGRGLDEMDRVGSFSRVALLHLAFDDERTIRQVCQHMLQVTVDQMAHAHAPEDVRLPAVAYELNDVRPLPRSPEVRGRIDHVKLADIFFIVNHLRQGYSILVIYDVSMYHWESVGLLVTEWMDSWVGRL